MDRTPSPSPEGSGQRPVGSARRRSTMFSQYSFGGTRPQDATLEEIEREQKQDADETPVRPHSSTWQVQSSFERSEFFGNLDPQGELTPVVRKTMRENELSEQNRQRLQESAQRVSAKLVVEVKIPDQTQSSWSSFRPTAYNTLRARLKLNDADSEQLWDMLNGGILLRDVTDTHRRSGRYNQIMDEMLIEWHNTH